MGSVCSTTDQDVIQSKVYTKALKEQKAEDEHIKKLLLLGAGESGKSTLFKQAISLYRAPFTEVDLKEYLSAVHNNTVDGMKMLVEQSDELAERYNDDRFLISSTLSNEKLLIDQFPPGQLMQMNHAKAIRILWRDKGIQHTYHNRSLYQLQDTVHYFFERVLKIAQPAYVPSETDALHTRIRTTGIKETEFKIGDGHFKLVDVGGQRSERRKWIHCFDKVTGVIYVTAISEYDQYVWEDEHSHRIIESATLFEQICNSQWFSDTVVILFLNKKDLFDLKIRVFPFGEHFPDYKGDPHDGEAALYHLQQLFESKNHNATRPIYTHITCATDRKNVEHVFNAIKDSMIRSALRDAALF